jgi:hypothetical protein
MNNAARDTQLDDIDYRPISELALEELEKQQAKLHKEGVCDIGTFANPIEYTISDVLSECEDEDLKGLFNDAIAAVYLNSNPLSIEMQNSIKEIKRIIKKMGDDGLEDKLIDDSGELA